MKHNLIDLPEEKNLMDLPKEILLEIFDIVGRKEVYKHRFLGEHTQYYPYELIGLFQTNKTFHNIIEGNYFSKSPEVIKARIKLRENGRKWQALQKELLAMVDEYETEWRNSWVRSRSIFSDKNRSDHIEIVRLSIEKTKPVNKYQLIELLSGQELSYAKDNNAKRYAKMINNMLKRIKEERISAPIVGRAELRKKAA